MITLDLGNNERVSRGLTYQNGMYIALTYSQSKWFKTEAGAVNWLAKRNLRPDGTYINN